MISAVMNNSNCSSKSWSFKNNNLFSSIYENHFCKISNESKQIFYYLYYFVVEEFYYIWTYETRDEMSNKILLQLQIIEEFTHIHFNLSFLNTQISPSRITFFLILSKKKGFNSGKLSVTSFISLENSFTSPSET